MALIKIKLRQRAAGPWGTAEPGAVIAVEAAVAKILIRSNQADAVDHPVLETAVAPSVETSSKGKRAAKPEPLTADDG